jgi:monoterpene epsilon-lactone hydrolase
MSLQAKLVRLWLRLFFKRATARDIQAVRRRIARLGHLVPPAPPEIEVLHLDLDGVRAVRVATRESREDRHVLYLHGGGHVAGSPVLYRDFIWRIAAATRACVTIIDHRLAPEHPFPAALDDAVAAYRRMLADGADPLRLAIMGESAGEASYSRRCSSSATKARACPPPPSRFRLGPISRSPANRCGAMRKPIRCCAPMRRR